MSDHSSAIHHSQKKAPVPGTNRKNTYLKGLFIVLLAVLAGIAFFAVNSGILAEENPAIPQHLITRINNERVAHNLSPVRIDNDLARRAERTSQEIRFSPIADNSPSGMQSDRGTNDIIYPKISWAVSSISLESPLFDTWIAEDKSFQSDILNKEYTNIGIGISNDGYNYHIVTKWK
jgi:uncharacterized protein YkwD